MSSKEASDAPRRRTPRALLVGLLAIAIAGGLIAGWKYQAYAAVHLRKPGRVPSCVLKSRKILRRPVLASGTEPRETVTGETVYLSRGEDLAVSCALQLDKHLARQLAGVLAEQEPIRRAQGFLKLVRDDIPADPAFDRQATAAYLFVDGAMGGLPQDLPEIKAIGGELDLLHVCRFDTRRPCPTRAPIPLVVWIAGVPAAGALLWLAGIGGAAAVGGIRRWREKRKGAATSKQEDSGNLSDAVSPPL